MSLETEVKNNTAVLNALVQELKEGRLYGKENINALIQQLASVTGIQGPQGETGIQGPQGETGADGADGVGFQLYHYTNTFNLPVGSEWSGYLIVDDDNTDYRGYSYEVRIKIGRVGSSNCLGYYRAGYFTTKGSQTETTANDNAYGEASVGGYTGISVVPSEVWGGIGFYVNNTSAQDQTRCWVEVIARGEFGAYNLVWQDGVA